MGIKFVTYFTQNESSNKSIYILDCGYHATTKGIPSSQTVVDHFSLHCIIDGKGLYQIHNHTHYLQKNDCFLLLPNTPIRYQSDQHEPWVYYWIGFDGIDALHLMQLCNISYEAPILHYENMEELTSILKPLTKLKNVSISDSYAALGQFHTLCSKLMRHNSNIKPLSRKQDYVNQTLSIIQNSYYRNISVQNIAESIGLERTYLYRIFKEIIGISIQEYITNLKIKRACYFLTNSNFPYCEIAYYCGYISEQYFSSAFKKNTGMSPSGYRKLTQSGTHENSPTNSF